MPLSVREVLKQAPVEASAPCRIDSGGTWDIKALALPLEPARPVTLNIALTLRTRVTLLPFRDGWVKISSDGFSYNERHPFRALPFDSPFGLFHAALSYFGWHGIHVHIRSDSPVRAALGGSSTALVALIKALSKLASNLGMESLSREEILHLGYHIEDAVSAGKCGIQDQAAAVYGGVTLWTWCFGERSSPFKKTPLLGEAGHKRLSRHILVAFSGRSHTSSRINRSWINRFLSAETRSGWLRANEVVKDLARAIEAEDWKASARCLREEMSIRRKITPDALIPVTETLIHQAEACGCGARFAGAGGGGSVWAIGEDVLPLSKKWASTLASVKGACILECGVESTGAA